MIKDWERFAAQYGNPQERISMRSHAGSVGTIKISIEKSINERTIQELSFPTIIPKYSK